MRETLHHVYRTDVFDPHLTEDHIDVTARGLNTTQTLQECVECARRVIFPRFLELGGAHPGGASKHVESLACYIYFFRDASENRLDCATGSFRLHTERRQRARQADNFSRRVPGNVGCRRDFFRHFENLRLGCNRTHTDFVDCRADVSERLLAFTRQLGDSTKRHGSVVDGGVCGCGKHGDILRERGDIRSRNIQLSTNGSNVGEFRERDGNLGGQVYELLAEPVKCLLWEVHGSFHAGKRGLESDPCADNCRCRYTGRHCYGLPSVCYVVQRVPGCSHTPGELLTVSRSRCGRFLRVLYLRFIGRGHISGVGFCGG